MSRFTERIELPNKEKIRTHREKENYKYLGILEADTIEQAEMKEKILKSTTNYIAEKSSKDKKT